jgi:hypothetical protein
MSDRDRRPQCPEHLRRAFLGEPKHVELLPGEHLYKFVSIPIVRHRILESPWWIRQKTFDELQRRARGLQKSVAELARSQMAITHEWNPGMDTMFIVVLTAKVEGWEGRARSQPVSLTDRTVAFTGGGEQFAVAALTWQQIGVNYSGWPPQ